MKTNHVPFDGASLAVCLFSNCSPPLVYCIHLEVRLLHSIHMEDTGKKSAQLLTTYSVPYEQSCNTLQLSSETHQKYSKLCQSHNVQESTGQSSVFNRRLSYGAKRVQQSQLKIQRKDNDRQVEGYYC